MSPEELAEDTAEAFRAIQRSQDAQQRTIEKLVGSGENIADALAAQQRAINKLIGVVEKQDQTIWILDARIEMLERFGPVAT